VSAEPASKLLLRLALADSDRALFDLDGKFQAMSFEDGDGLVPGTYRVRVEMEDLVLAFGGPAGHSDNKVAGWQGHDNDDQR